MPCSSCTPGRHGKCVNLSTLQVKTNSLTTAVAVNPIHQFTTSQTSAVTTPEHNKDDYVLNTTEHSDLLHDINQEHPTTTLPPLPPFIPMAILLHLGLTQHSIIYRSNVKSIHRSGFLEEKCLHSTLGSFRKIFCQ